MTRKQLVEQLGAKCGITVTQAEAYLNALQSIIQDTLKNNRAVNWWGFGRFSAFLAKGVERKIPSGVRKGELIRVPAYKRVKFKAGEALKKAISN